MSTTATIRNYLDARPRGPLCSRCGERRPAWTRELLVKVMHGLTGVRIHVATMGRALQRVAVYEDEVDIHLNPKIELDWMNRGQQKTVVTPGQNQKRYLAGAMHTETGLLTVVEGQRMNSWLFLALLDALVEDYPAARCSHVILDNYRIPDSQITQLALARYAGRIVLRFLPPCYPNANKIERLPRDLHADVTRNHNCSTINDLTRNVRCFLGRRLVHRSLKVRKLAA